MSLPLIPELPQSWLKSGLEKKYPDLCTYVRRHKSEVFGNTIAVEQAIHPEETEVGINSQDNLPWRAPCQPSATARATQFARSLTENLPFYEDSKIITKSTTSDITNKKAGDPAYPLLSSTVLSIGFVAATLLAIAGGYLSGLDLSTLGHRSSEKASEGMGAAGDLLGGLEFATAPRRRDGFDD